MSRGMKAFVYYSFWVVLVIVALEFGDVITAFIRNLIWGE